MVEFITRTNLLALLESMGNDLKCLASPNHYAYEDRGRAKAFESLVGACRVAWRKISDGADPLPVLEAFQRQVRTGTQVNHLGLVIDGLKGRWEKDESWLRALPSGYHWVTYKGDFFGIDAGDRLNRPCVSRIANQYVGEERKTIELSKEIAGLIPNPCTRIKIDTQVL